MADRLEIYYTPRHGSWLNMAEIELSVLQRQCLDRRLGNRATMEQEVAAWVAARNETATSIEWRGGRGPASSCPSRVGRRATRCEQNTIRLSIVADGTWRFPELMAMAAD